MHHWVSLSLKADSVVNLVFLDFTISCLQENNDSFEDNVSPWNIMNI